MKYNI